VLNSFAPKRTKRSVLPQKYVRGRFSQKIRNANVLFRRHKTSLRTIFCPQSFHIIRFSPIVIVVWFGKKILTGNMFFRKTILGAYEAKWSEVFVLNSFAPKRTKRSVLPQKYVRGRFSQKIRNANVLFRRHETSLRNNFAPNRSI
jgi:hypothetical protein